MNTPHYRSVVPRSQTTKVRRGLHEVERHAGGKITLTVGDFSEQSTITAWDPPKRLAYRSDEGADGSFHAMEYLVEGREGGGECGPIRVGHHLFAGDVNGEETAKAWQAWLNRVFSG